MRNGLVMLVLTAGCGVTDPAQSVIPPDIPDPTDDVGNDTDVDTDDTDDTDITVTEVYELDAGASPFLQFTAWGAFNSEQHGTWHAYNVQVVRRGDLGDIEVHFLAQTDSVDGGINALTNHLKTDDFFDVANHPEATFDSTAVAHISGDDYEVTGDMTLRGTTRSMTFTATITEDGSDGLRSTANMEFSRWDYGLYADNVTKAGGDGANDRVVVDYDVRLELQ